jgi:two-component system, NarL family, nitrate/nitrite response regulator NarL
MISAMDERTMAALGGTLPTILIVDDSEAFRVQARTMLEADGFDVVAEASDLSGAIAAWHATLPQLVLLDVNLPDGDGFAIVDMLERDGTRPIVVMTSTRDAATYRRRLERTRAVGFILKNELSGAAIRSLMDGAK